ncbi:MAG: chemotaxis protein CheW [Thermodesulfobacteriota bacterium]
MEKPPTIVEDMDCDDDDLYEREEPKEESLQFIVFRLAREWYGVEISKVKEIIKVGKVTYLPSSPEHIAGIVSLRGNILSVTDLKAIFRLPYEEPTGKTRIVAVESGIFDTGLLVDEVVESIEVPVSKIEPPLLTMPAEAGRCIEGQCWTGSKLIALLSVEKILDKKT